MKIDRSRFCFQEVEEVQNNKYSLNTILQGINTIMESIVEAKPYVLDWDHVLSEYDQLGMGDVCEFAASYSFGWHAMNLKLKDNASKQSMYNDIIDGIIQKRQNVK
jgi:hypothetical protein